MTTSTKDFTDMPYNVRKYYRLVYLVKGGEFYNKPVENTDLQIHQQKLTKEDWVYINKHIKDWFILLPHNMVQFRQKFIDDLMEDTDE